MQYLPKRIGRTTRGVIWGCVLSMFVFLLLVVFESIDFPAFISFPARVIIYPILGVFVLFRIIPNYGNLYTLLGMTFVHLFYPVLFGFFFYITGRKQTRMIISIETTLIILLLALWIFSFYFFSNAGGMP